jgi:hypothetical protein
MKILTAVLLSLALVSSAQASGKKEPAPDQQYVQVSAVALPVIVNRNVANYVFVIIRIDLTPKADVAKAREKEPWFRDAIVRAAHRTPFTIPGDTNHVDAARVIASVTQDAQVILGPGVVKSVSIVSQTPKMWQNQTPS